MEKHIITMLGEKDHGKSTLIGSLLIASGSATEQRINEAKKYAKRGRFEPGYILDSFAEERAQEMTIDTTRAEMVYKGAMYEFIDVPGHLELIKNMMSGASNGEMAVLMVSMKPGEGLKPQTKRHLFISNMFGIKSLVVAVNKMDMVGYSKEAFEKMKAGVSAYLDAIGFSGPVAYVPISAYNSDNLIKRSDNMPWYMGKPLADLIAEQARMPAPLGKNGTRAIVQDVSYDSEGTIAYCMLNSGSISEGDTVRIEPSQNVATVAKLYVKGEPAKSAGRGTNIAVLFGKKQRIARGDLICGADGVPHERRKFKALVFLSAKMERKGELSIKINNNSIGARISGVESVISPVSGKKTGNDPSGIKQNVAAVIGIEMEKEYPIEKYSDYRELGRFALYTNGRFAGIGIVI